MVETDVILITNGLCAKSRAIREKSIELGIEPKVIDLAAKPETAEAYAHLFGDGRPHSPGFIIGDRAWRNPAIDDLEKLLARAGLVERRPIHYPKQQRVVWHMQPSDAFASYSQRSDGLWVFGHIETPSELRGTGLGAQLAKDLFGWIEANKIDALLTCSFLRKVAATREEWSSRFL
ncbi:MAG: hypothetical protein E6R12_05245 [Sphingomonadales bacterium]|jgi:predicted GNAT family acetyltransferase|nr:MAG: hypothetical protein E6R12_05245 [Sphingomonadales bacterium]